MAQATDLIEIDSEDEVDRGAPIDLTGEPVVPPPAPVKQEEEEEDDDDRTESDAQDDEIMKPEEWNDVEIPDDQQMAEPAVESPQSSSVPRGGKQHQRLGKRTDPLYCSSDSEDERDQRDEELLHAINPSIRDHELRKSDGQVDMRHLLDWISKCFGTDREEGAAAAAAAAVKRTSGSFNVHVGTRVELLGPHEVLLAFVASIARQEGYLAGKILVRRIDRSDDEQVARAYMQQPGYPVYNLLIQVGKYAKADKFVEVRLVVSPGPRSNFDGSENWRNVSDACSELLDKYFDGQPRHGDWDEDCTGDLVLETLLDLQHERVQAKARDEEPTELCKAFFAMTRSVEYSALVETAESLHRLEKSREEWRRQDAVEDAKWKKAKEDEKRRAQDIQAGIEACNAMEARLDTSIREFEEAKERRGSTRSATKARKMLQGD